MRQKEFVEICNDPKFWQWIRNKSTVKYVIPSDKKKFLTNLYGKIENRNYYPSPPYEYLTIDKGHGVIRTIPCFQLEDLCVYYYCARKLEGYIAVNHVVGTYGGFGFSGKLRKLEEKRSEDAQTTIQIDNDSYVFLDPFGYATTATLNPGAWYKEWGDFNKKLYLDSKSFKSGFVADLDIANFYDSVQLDNLEYKLRRYVPNNCNDVIYLLLHFLRYWNRHINFYRQQGAGIPQDLFGECSRILANFYLQTYDKRISKYCNGRGGKYFRYADDQVIFAKTKPQLEVMISKASSLLMREGLNFNQKKVKIMTLNKFKEYYSFQNFIDLDIAQKKIEKDRIKILRQQIIFYFDNKENLRKSGLSLLKRILGILSKTRRKPSNFLRLKKHLYSKDFLFKNYSFYEGDLSRIYAILNKREKAKFLKILDTNIERCLYTTYLYNLRIFYKAIKRPTRAITYRIKTVNKFYSFKN